MSKIETIEEIQNRMENDGDLREGEGYEPYEYLGSDDLGFYQQGCEFLSKQLATLQKTIIDYEQTEASVCPEDVGIGEYVSSLQSQLSIAKTENEQLTKARKGGMAAASLLDDAAKKLKEITGEQNVWKSIDMFAALQEKTRWVPVGERLPEKTEEDLRPQVLVFDGESASVALWRHYDFGWDFDTDRGVPTHWRPVDLP